MYVYLNQIRIFFYGSKYSPNAICSPGCEYLQKTNKGIQNIYKILKTKLSLLIQI